jgi:proline iminopeptidase
VSLAPGWQPGPTWEAGRERENCATLVTHYWANDCFLPGPQRLRDRVGELDGIPGVLIHGRRDISGPAITPWLLHRSWPTSRLEIVESEGHGGPIQAQLVTDAVDRFAMSQHS